VPGRKSSITAVALFKAWSDFYGSKTAIVLPKSAQGIDLKYPFVFKLFCVGIGLRTADLAPTVSYKITPTNAIEQRPRWSRGCVLASFSQVRGFKPGRSLRIFQGKKIPSTPSFRGEVKPAVPSRRFTACKRSLNVTWKSAFRQNSRLLFLAH
jgi:hypothetical protein